MPFDFKQLLDGPMPKKLVNEVRDDMWADLGRRMYDNVMSEQFVMAVVTSFLASANPPPNIQPNQFAAKKMRAYIFSGTVAR